MACPENSTLQICELLSETGTGLGEMANGATANGGLTKFLFLLAIIAAAVGIVSAIAFIIKKSISNAGGKNM